MLLCVRLGVQDGVEDGVGRLWMMMVGDEAAVDS